MENRRQAKKKLAQKIEKAVHRLAHFFFSRWPRKAPAAALLANCRIVSHRGEFDNRDRLENTLAAFDAAAAAGVWGIEMDIRWTRDLVPVVFHDPDTRRLFGRAVRIADTPLDSLKRRFPLIPTLEEVAARFGVRHHLMIEIKAEPYPDPTLQAKRLNSTLQHLNPVKDFHLMGLHPELFNYFDSLPPETFLPIASIRMDRFSRMAVANEWAGVSGQYLLAGESILHRHHRLGQGVGTGFADSRRCLYREVARGVDWIFSNQAAKLQAICGEKAED
jgi:glycerophosphoryl diester phosphodiesterase